ALARFIRDGHLDRHIYRMRSVYRNKCAMLIEALHWHFGDRAVIRGDEAGMHLLVEFPFLGEAPDWSRSREYGVAVDPVEDYCMRRGFRTRQIGLGYGNIRERDIEPGVERLSRFVREPGRGGAEAPNKNPGIPSLRSAATAAARKGAGGVLQAGRR